MTFDAGPAGTYFYWATTAGLTLDKDATARYRAGLIAMMARTSPDAFKDGHERFEFSADSKALTGPLAIGGAVQLALHADHVRACIRAVAWPKRADVMPLRHFGCFFEQVVQID